MLALDRSGSVVRDTGVIDGLDPGGGVFGPDGRFYAGSRNARTIIAFPAALEGAGEYILPAGVVPFPRGVAFGGDGGLFLASGIGPAGDGDDTIMAFAPGGAFLRSWSVKDAEFSPFDLAVAPNGNIAVSSEHPFGAPAAPATVREYEGESGRLVRAFSPEKVAAFQKPRGLRFGPDGNLYCVARDEVVAFDFVSGRRLGAFVRFPRLYGQAFAFFPQ